MIPQVTSPFTSNMFVLPNNPDFDVATPPSVELLIDSDDVAFKMVLGEEENPAFKQIYDKIASRQLCEAKKELGKLLEEIEHNDGDQSILGFRLMSKIHLLEKKYPEAAGILWYAKRLDSEGNSHEKIDLELDFIEQSLLSKATGTEGSLRGYSQAKQDQERLKKLRETISEVYLSIQSISNNFERAKALRNLYQNTITVGMKAYISALVQDVIQQLKAWGQNIPCEYAMIGLGSLVREEMTPYSDFEFAILIDSENEDDKEYFRLLTNLLHLRFINLGETILPSLDIKSLDWIFDTITPRGLSFDGSMPTACKTPLGKKQHQAGDYELIHNPQKMSQLQFIDGKDSEQERLWILQRYHLPTILASCTYVTGSPHGNALVDIYRQQVQIILKNKESKNCVLALIKDDLEHYKPYLAEEESGKNYNVKKDLYRFPNTMFEGLANYFCLKASSSWERIEELESMGFFTTTAAQDLKELVMLSQELRLSTYLHHGCQRDLLDFDTQKANLQELYFRVIPFAATMATFCAGIESVLPTACLTKERFYDNSTFNQGIIALRHMDYFEAYRLLSLKIYDTFEYYESLGLVNRALGKDKEAEQAFCMAIEKRPSCKLYTALANVRYHLAKYKGQESAEEALLKGVKLALTNDDNKDLEEIYRDLAYLYKECGDYDSARLYLNLCRQISEKNTSSKSKDLEYGVILDLGIAKTYMLEALILQDIDNEYEKSKELCENAGIIFKGYYRRTNHPSIAISYCNAGHALQKEGKYQEALNYHEKALHIQQALLGSMHPDVAKSYHNIGTILSDLGKHQEGLEHLEKALKIQLEIFGTQHPAVADSYSEVGYMYEMLDQYSEALEKQKIALEIMEKIYGDKHIRVAHANNMLGITFDSLGNYQKALEHLQKALAIWIEAFGEKHTNVATAYNNIGSILGNMGKPQESLEHNLKALNLKIEIFGQKHPELAVQYNNVGKAFDNLGRHEEALEHKKNALDMLIATFGKIHPQVATCYNNVGYTLGNLEKYEEALEFHREAHGFEVSIYGENHTAVAISHINLGTNLCALERVEEGKQHVEQALIIFINVFREDHPYVASTYISLGVALDKLGKYDEALENKRKGLKINKKIYGKNHPSIADAYKSIAQTLRSAGQAEKALKYKEKARAIRLATQDKEPP